MPTAYPLTWPDGWPRSKAPVADRFKTSLERAIINVETELKRFAADSSIKVDGVLISSNFSLTQRRPKDPGVAVYFTWDGISTCIAVDRYGSIEANLQAISLVIEAERTKLRHGGLNLVRAAFRGYAALPPPSSTGRKWSEVFGLQSGQIISRDDIERMYRERARKAHPDTGGSDAAMAELNAAREAALASLRKTSG